MNLYLAEIYWYFGAMSNMRVRTIMRLVKAEDKQHAGRIVQRYIDNKLNNPDARYTIHDTLE